MRLVVTGREGQLVRSLVEWAARVPGVEIIALGRPDLDLEQPDSIAPAIAASRPDIVINAAAYTAVDLAEDEPNRAQEVNGAAAGRVAAAARDAGVPIIQISTDYVFDGRSREPLREDSPTAPLGAYGRSKLQGEESVRSANPRHVIVRTAWVYSPFGRNFLKTMLALAETREELNVVADQRGSPTCALDLADGLIVLARHLARGDLRTSATYHLAGSGDASWFEFAQHIMEEAERLGRPSAQVKPISTADFPTKARRPAFSLLDSRRFARDLGFEMPHWRDASSAVIERLAAERDLNPRS